MSCPQWRVPWIAALLLLPRFLAAEELRLGARDLFSKSVTSDLRLSADDAAIELESGELFEDDGPAAGFSYHANEENLSPSTWLKKELLISSPRAKKATLLVGPGGDIEALINGNPQKLVLDGKAGGYWQAYSFPADALQAGKNEIVLHGSGKVWIARDDEFSAGSVARTKHPNRSARSTDGGKTWDYDRLGTSGKIDGEYYVRLFLDHYRPSGVLTTAVLDSGNLSCQAIAPPLASIPPIRITTSADLGTTGSLVTKVRSGSTPIPDATKWSPWRDLAGSSGLLEKPAGRYFQIELALGAADPIETPKLKQIVIESSPKPASDWIAAIKVLESHNEEIDRSSIPFEYEPQGHPRLKRLREEYKLDEVVKGAKTELELVARLAAWSARQWEKGHLQEAYPAWDALDILASHRDGRPVGGFCEQYNVVFLQACESFGLSGRAVSIGPGDHGVKIRGGHEVVEIWSSEFTKWIYVDGNAAWYFVDEVTKVPLSLFELRQRQLQTLKGERPPPVELVRLAETPLQWQGLESWPPFVELRLIPRSNFLEKQSPLPLNQGMRGWFWTGHHVWTDSASPASLLYSNRVSDRRNWQWTLNQARCLLEATTTPGELRVHLDTVTPSFDTFLADIDRNGEAPVASGFSWKLHQGKNRLEVRSRNKLGRAGISSWIVLDYK